ncbi:MAG: hypothetical protein PUD59_00475 [bacterium]|nr:hypothetical protein [bacterium]
MDKIKRILLIVFIALFFAACAFFAVGIVIPGASVAAEGAGKAPALFSDGKINSDFGDEFEGWFSKSFAFRGKVVDLFTSFRAKVFKTGNDQVIIGEDDFLFFADTVDSYTGQNTMTDDEISAAAESLCELQKYAEAHGCGFLFVCAPNKATVYPDMMPDRYIKCAGDTDLDRLYCSLEEKGVNFADLRGVLAEHASDELIYHKRDTHWNGLGAKYAFDEIMETLGVTVPDFGEASAVHDFEGDLDSLLYPGHVACDDDVVYDLSGRYIFTSAYSNPMNMSISTRGAGEGKALIFRDSFGNAIIPYAASTFAEVKFERASPYRIDLLEEYDADCVIVLIAERNIRDLIGSDARVQN